MTDFSIHIKVFYLCFCLCSHLILEGRISCKEVIPHIIAIFKSKRNLSDGNVCLSCLLPLGLYASLYIFVIWDESLIYFILSCALYRSSPGLYSPASSPMWRWWLGLCFTRPVTLPCCGAASPSRPAPWSEPSPCSLWSTSTTCSPGLKNAWITAVSRSEICTVFFYEFCFL